MGPDANCLYVDRAQRLTHLCRAKYKTTMPTLYPYSLSKSMWDPHGPAGWAVPVVVLLCSLSLSVFALSVQQLLLFLKKRKIFEYKKNVL